MVSSPAERGALPADQVTIPQQTETHLEDRGSSRSHSHSSAVRLAASTDSDLVVECAGGCREERYAESNSPASVEPSLAEELEYAESELLAVP